MAKDPKLNLGSSLKEYIEQTVAEINEAATQGYNKPESISFKVNVVESGISGKKLDLRILKGDSVVENQVVQGLEFTLPKKDYGAEEAKRMEEEARKKEAEFKKVLAEKKVEGLKTPLTIR